MTERAKENREQSTPKPGGGDLPQLPVEYFPEHLRRVSPALHAATSVNGAPLAYEFGGSIGIGFMSALGINDRTLESLIQTARQEGIRMVKRFGDGHTWISLETRVPKDNSQVSERNAGIARILGFLEQHQEALKPVPFDTKVAHDSTGLSESDFKKAALSSQADIAEFVVHKTPRLYASLRLNPPSGVYEMAGRAVIQTIPSPSLDASALERLRTEARFDGIDVEHLQGAAGRMLRLSVDSAEPTMRRTKIDSLIRFAAAHLDQIFEHPAPKLQQ